jgi:hypothetical protein
MCGSNCLEQTGVSIDSKEPTVKGLAQEPFIAFNVISFNCCNLSVRNKVSFGYAELVSMLMYYNFRMKHFSTLIETMVTQKRLCSSI